MVAVLLFFGAVLTFTKSWHGFILFRGGHKPKEKNIGGENETLF